MLKEGTERLRSMLENVEVRLKDNWRVRVTKLALCEGEIIFFDRTVNGVRKPTTVVDVQLKLEWEASLSPSASTLGGVSTCSELSIEALSEGLTMETKVTDGSTTSSSAVAAEVRSAVTGGLTELLDTVGRGFFQDLHEALHIPPPAIAVPSDRPMPRPARPQPKASVARPSSSHSATANLTPPDRKDGRPTKNPWIPKKERNRAGRSKTSTAFFVCMAAGIVVGVGIWAWRSITTPGSSSSNGNSSNLLARAQPRGTPSGSAQIAHESADEAASLLNLLSPQVGPIRDLREMR